MLVHFSFMVRRLLVVGKHLFNKRMMASLLKSVVNPVTGKNEWMVENDVDLCQEIARCVFETAFLSALYLQSVVCLQQAYLSRSSGRKSMLQSKAYRLAATVEAEIFNDAELSIG